MISNQSKQKKKHKSNKTLIKISFKMTLQFKTRKLLMLDMWIKIANIKLHRHTYDDGTRRRTRVSLVLVKTVILKVFLVQKLTVVQLQFLPMSTIWVRCRFLYIMKTKLVLPLKIPSKQRFQFTLSYLLIIYIK